MFRFTFQYCLWNCSFVAGIWTSHVSRGHAVMEIGQKLKDRLHISTKIQIGYQAHQDSMDKAGSVTKNLYTV